MEDKVEGLFHMQIPTHLYTHIVIQNTITLIILLWYSFYQSFLKIEVPKNDWFTSIQAEYWMNWGGPIMRNQQP